MSGEDVEYSGDWEQVRARDPLPTDRRNQICAVCDDARVVWLHPLSEEHAVFMLGAAKYTLPTFWMLCDACEEAHASGEAAMMSRIPTGGADLDRAAVIAFRRADLGGRSLAQWILNWLRYVRAGRKARSPEQADDSRRCAGGEMAQPAEVLASGIMDLVSRHNTFPVSAASARRTHADWEPRIGPDGAAELVRTDAYALRMVLTGMLGIAAGPVGVALGQLTAFGTLAAALLLLSIWNGYRMVRATVRAQKFGGLFLGLTNGHGGTLAVPVRHGVNFHDDWVRKMRASEMTS